MLALRILAACGGAPADGPAATAATGDTGPVVIALADVGRACVAAEGTPPEAEETTFVAGGATAVRVVLEDCASGCATAIEATCAARLVSSEIVIEASGSYTLPAGDPSCPTACVEVAATCEGPVLDTGTWILHYGDAHGDEFFVPGPSPVPCAGTPG